MLHAVNFTHIITIQLQALRALVKSSIFIPFREAVCRLERCGFKDMGVTADGLSVNRHFFKPHEDGSTDNPLHKTVNPYTSEDRCLYFF